MRIVFVSPLLGDVYGIERVILESSRLLAAAGHSVAFVTGTLLGDSPMPGPVNLCPTVFSPNFWTSASSLEKSWQELNQAVMGLEPDLVHLGDFLHFTLLDKLTKRFPTVMTSHLFSPTCPASGRAIGGGGMCESQGGWRCLWNQRTYHCLDNFRNLAVRTVVVRDYLKKRKASSGLRGVAAVSRTVERTLLQNGWKRERVLYVPNPVVIPQRQETLSSNLTLCCVSRLEAQKGISLLIEALSQFNAVNWQLEMCGDGSRRESFERLVADRGLSKQIHFRGKLSSEETTRIIQKSHLLIQPNVAPETFGMAVAEAIGMGTPVLAANIPALNEIIQDGENGWLFDVGSVTHLRERLFWILTHPEVRDQVAKAGPSTITDRYSPAIHLQATLDFYSRSLSKSASRSR